MLFHKCAVAVRLRPEKLTLFLRDAMLSKRENITSMGILENGVPIYGLTKLLSHAKLGPQKEYGMTV
jgi:hypothetical protein